MFFTTCLSEGRLRRAENFSPLSRWGSVTHGKREVEDEQKEDQEKRKRRQRFIEKGGAVRVVDIAGLFHRALCVVMLAKTYLYQEAHTYACRHVPGPVR